MEGSSVKALCTLHLGKERFVTRSRRLDPLLRLEEAECEGDDSSRMVSVAGEFFFYTGGSIFQFSVDHFFQSQLDFTLRRKLIDLRRPVG